jgi:hypothetical protein
MHDTSTVPVTAKRLAKKRRMMIFFRFTGGKTVSVPAIAAEDVSISHFSSPSLCRI